MTSWADWQQEKEKIHRLIYLENRSLRQVGNLYGVSYERIRQLLSKWKFAPVSLVREPKSRDARYNRPSFYERFMRHVEVTPDCWIWRGYKHPQGYGVVQMIKYTREVIAYRISWVLFRGDLMPGEWVRQKCKRRDCVNPAHLKLHKPS
jgi:hypothetical protein